MSGINTVVEIGRLAEKPELRKTGDGTSVTSFSIAVDGHYNKQTKEKKTNWIDCVAWRQTADFITSYFNKGSQIAIVGSLQTRTYTDKNGNTRKAVEVLVDTVSFCGNKKDEQRQAPEIAGEATGRTHYAAAAAPKPAKDEQMQIASGPPDIEFVEVGDDDDLPF